MKLSSTWTLKKFPRKCTVEYTDFSSPGLSELPREIPTCHPGPTAPLLVKIVGTRIGISGSNFCRGWRFGRAWPFLAQDQGYHGDCQKNLYFMEELKWRALKCGVERCNQDNLEIKGKDSQKCRVRCTLIYLEQVGTGWLLQDNNLLSPFENPCVFKMSGSGEAL